MSDSWSATETSPHDPKWHSHSINEIPKHEGKSMQMLEDLRASLSPLFSAEVMSKIDWKASIDAKPMNEMEAAEEKWRKYFGLK